MPPSPSHTLTDEQSAIISAVSARTGSVQAEAGAGCAKSYTLEQAARGIKVPALSLAFNKSIADGMKRSFPSNFSVATFSALGFRTWGRHLSGVTLKVDDRKVGRLVRSTARDHRVDLSGEQWESVRNLVARAQFVGLVPDAAGAASDTPETWDRLCSEVWIDQEDTEQFSALARAVLIAAIAEARAGTLSFDDMLYCPLFLGAKFPQYPVLFVDENQDLNPVNHEVIRRIAPGRIISVGDRRQSIYGFRGAHGQSAEVIRGLAGEAWTELPLMTTFRCPRAVVARQQSHVPGFRAWSGAAEGAVLTWRLRQLDGPSTDPEGDAIGWTWADVVEVLPPGGEAAVLCRNNAPLLSLAFRLIRANVPVRMLGREIGKGLVALARKLAPDDGTPGDTLRGLVQDWRSREVALALANEHEERQAGINDRADCLLAVLDQGVATAGGLRRALESLFSRTDGVTLGSIHKAKGLEWDLVVHLDPWRVPSRQAKKALEAGDLAPMEQEKNLRYVAETRTKRVLILASLGDFQ